MGACLSKTETEPLWPELPPEISVLILCHLADHGDRLGFAAVCHEWRLAAGQQVLPPAMPCINLGGGAYHSLIGGDKVRHFPTPKGYHASNSFGGGWLFYYHEDSRRCFLRRPFSGAAIEVRRSLLHLPAVTTGDFPIVVFGGSMDMKMVICSSGFVVALFRHPQCCYLGSLRPAWLQQRILVWPSIVQPRDHSHTLYVCMDIAFYDGKVFALSCWEQLFCHGADGETDHDHRQPIVQHASEARPDTFHTRCYLVVSSDKRKLLMVRWRKDNNTDGHPAMGLWVFVADFGTGRWLEVKDLGGQALFLGRNCSMAFTADSMEHWGPRFRGENCVFLLGTEWARSLGQPLSYNMD